jgi:hypothetical protein
MQYVSQDPWRSYRYYKNSEDLPKAVIIGDSYIWMFMLENLAESFSELVFIHLTDINNLNNLISILNPDLVVFAGLSSGCITTINSYILPVLEIPSKKQEIDVNRPPFWIDYANEKLVNNHKIFIDPSVNEISFEGWAIDPFSRTTASRVIIQVEDKSFQVAYGIEKESVVIVFENSDYLYSGFKITLDSNALLEAESFSVTVVSNDGTYAYEPIVYHVEAVK